jgi:hypothetical protein
LPAHTSSLLQFSCCLFNILKLASLPLAIPQPFEAKQLFNISHPNAFDSRDKEWNFSMSIGISLKGAFSLSSFRLGRAEKVRNAAPRQLGQVIDLFIGL